MRAKMLGAPKLVFDFSFGQYMEKKHCNSSTEQFIHFHGSNRKSQQPFDVHITNAPRNSTKLLYLQSLMPNILEDSCPIEVHSKCYSELYPRENLVYITPYSRTVLTEYNSNDIYVVGAMVDNGNFGPMVMANAKRLGIRTAWLRIYQLTDWGKTTRNLPINIIGNILLDFKNWNDWYKALEHIPQRMRKPPRSERHHLHRVINTVTDPRDELPPMQWEDIRDQTRAMDDAKSRALANPFRRSMDDDESDTKRNPFD